MDTNIIDISANTLLVEDTIKYTDKTSSKTGTIRYNGISDIYEVISLDEQSGDSIVNVTKIEKIWQ